MGEKLKVQVEPHDALRKGLPTAVEDVSIPKHPVEVAQKAQEEKYKDYISNEFACQYGLAAAMKRNADEHLLKKVHRFPGLRSSNLAVDILKGNDSTLSINEWIGDQDLNPQYFANFHATMEHKLKM